MTDRDALLRELMAVFDELPPSLREAINYAPEPLDPTALAKLCRRHGAGNVLAMIKLKLQAAGPLPPRAQPSRTERAGGTAAGAPTQQSWPPLGPGGKVQRSR